MVSIAVRITDGVQSLSICMARNNSVRHPIFPSEVTKGDKWIP